MHGATIKIFKGKFIGFNFIGQAVQVVECLTEKDRIDKFFSVKNFQIIGVEQSMREEDE
jgi:hypothetical protein